MKRHRAVRRVPFHRAQRSRSGTYNCLETSPLHVFLSEKFHHSLITSDQVEVVADKEKSSEKGADFFKEFDLVIATACSKVGTYLCSVLRIRDPVPF
jgi:hypothetical protein